MATARLRCAGPPLVLSPGALWLGTELRSSGTDTRTRAVVGRVDRVERPLPRQAGASCTASRSSVRRCERPRFFSAATVRDGDESSGDGGETRWFRAEIADRKEACADGSLALVTLSIRKSCSGSSSEPWSESYKVRGVGFAAAAAGP